jgi:hypothetical protein
MQMDSRRVRVRRGAKVTAGDIRARQSMRTSRRATFAGSSSWAQTALSGGERRTSCLVLGQRVFADRRCHRQRDRGRSDGGQEAQLQRSACSGSRSAFDGGCSREAEATAADSSAATTEAHVANHADSLVMGRLACDTRGLIDLECRAGGEDGAWFRRPIFVSWWLAKAAPLARLQA